jgi:hypothetical protein
VLAGAAFDPRRNRGHHFHEHFDLASDGTNFFHPNYDRTTLKSLWRRMAGLHNKRYLCNVTSYVTVQHQQIIKGVGTELVYQIM